MEDGLAVVFGWKKLDTCLLGWKGCRVVSSWGGGWLKLYPAGAIGSWCEGGGTS